MEIRVITQPTEQPITIDDIKAQCRVLSSHEDGLIKRIISGAVAFAEKTQNRSLMTQTVELTLDSWPNSGFIRIPRGNLQSVESIKFTDSAGVEYTLAAPSYYVSISNRVSRVVLNSGYSWPSNELRPIGAIKVTFVSGYASKSDIPDTTIQGLCMLAADWFNNFREDSTIAVEAYPVPNGAKVLFEFERIDPHEIRQA